ncbi:indole-3-glycerol phosphate synthase TrpC [Chloroflexota bacterium]
MILDEIVTFNRRELEKIKENFPLEKIKGTVLEQTEPLDFGTALRGDGIRMITEVKKASPSKGVIREDFLPVQIARVYADNGAAAISVLTEEEYFRGSLEYLRGIRRSIGSRIPLLRKDFIFDPYQVYQSRAYGADALLLIVAILSPGQLDELLNLSHDLGMKCLVEVHNEAELETALKSGAGIIGINNRDLTTFNVDIATTERLRPLIPSDRIVVSESGIKTRADIDKLKEWGVDAVLVGEALMSSYDITAAMRALL